MNRNLALVTASLCVWGIGEGFFIYFQPLYLQEWGADPLLIGGILGSMGIAMMVAQVPAGYLSDRFGSRAIMWASWILGTLAAWVMALANSLPAFVVGMVIYGATGFVLAPMNSYITNVRGKLTVGRALTLVSGLYSLGAMIGPIVGGIVADKFGLRIVYYFAGGLFFISTLIVLMVDKKPEIHHSDQESSKPKGLFSNYRFLAFLGITFITLFALYLPQPFSSNFLQNQHHLSRTTIGLLGAVGSLGTAVITLAIGNLNSSIGFVIGQIWMLIFAFFLFKGESAFAFGIGYFFIGGYRFCRSMVLAIARNLIHPGETGLAYGLIETASAASMIAAPILAGALYRNDPYSVYWISVLLLIFVIALNSILFFSINKRKKPHHDPSTTDL
ncbi:MAG: MFS transporter [Chloroflexi bacterium]|nr:MFS transporter [Chloroflexota bacterium]